MPIYRILEKNTPLSQGDIFINVPYWRPHRKSKDLPWPNITQRGNFPLDLQTNAFAILATQTCDIARANEFLFIVAMPAEQVLQDLAKNIEHPMSETEFRTWIVNNLHPRYHFFEQFDSDGKIIIPELVANFRSPFTLRSDYVNEKLLPDGHRVLCLEEMYGADFGNRFGHYFARVATDRNMQSL
jgi:DNA-binding cell septation regulator SpoVG